MPLRMLYDPTIGPTREAWLAIYEDDDCIGVHERAILEYHRREGIAMPVPRWHARIHYDAELHLALDEQGARAKLAELLAGGLDRHEAVHAIGTVIARTLERESDSDRNIAVALGLEHGLASLTVERWLELRARQHVRKERPAWVEELAECEAVRGLDARLRARILAMGTEAVPTLLEVVEAELADPVDDLAAVHAVELLGALRDSRAIDVLVRTVALPDEESFFRHRALHALVAIGPPALESVLAAFDAAADRGDWCQILSELGVTDERIFARLSTAMPDDPLFRAESLARYGDPRGLPLVHRAFEAFRFTADPAGQMAAREFVWAVEDLGGQLTEAERNRLAIFEPSAVFVQRRDSGRDRN